MGFGILICPEASSLKFRSDPDYKSLGILYEITIINYMQIIFIYL